MGEARDIMDRVTQAAMSGDVETLRGLYAEEAVIETPDQGTITGRDAIVEWISGFQKAFPDLTYEPLNEYEIGNTAIDEGAISGTHTGPLEAPTGETVPPTGKRVRVRETDLATVENGKVTSHRFYFDQMEFLAQLGLVPEGVAS
jgi:ketosteroid isomerase-like protein